MYLRAQHLVPSTFLNHFPVLYDFIVYRGDRDLSFEKFVFFIIWQFPLYDLDHNGDGRAG